MNDPDGVEDVPEGVAPDDTDTEVIDVSEIVASPVQEVEAPDSPEIIDASVLPDVQPIQERDRRRETARIWIAVILGVVFLVTAFWVLATATFGEGTAWANTKEALQILLPVESSLLGSAVVFYFTGSGEQR